MRRKLLTLSLAALTIGLLGSCSKINERIDNLEKRVDGIEATSIASVQQQIDGIKTSINDLKAADVAINGKIDDLKTAAETQQTLIDALKEADIALGQKDEELEGRIATLEGQVATINGQIEALVNADIAINTRIDELKSYVDTQIGKTKDWAEETFATLTQYEKTADDLAALSVTVTGISTTLAGVQTSISGLDTKIDGINTNLQGKITAAKTELEGKITTLKTELEGKITSAISASEASITSWINKQLEGYYTITEVDAKITGLNTAIEAAKGTSKYRIDSLATELTALKTTVDTEKANIRSEYKTAIDEAINKLDGEIRGALLDSIAAVNGRAEALDTRVTTLEGKVLNLEGNVNKLLAMIQSVSITPAYSDGSVEAVDGILTLKCIVRPAEVLTVMQSLKDSLLIYADSVKVKTKAATSAYMEIKVKEASVLDAAQGAITLKADISEYLPKGADKALTVALKIKNGISDYTTEFVPVTVSEKPIETIANVLATVDGFPNSDTQLNIPTNAWVSTKGAKAFTLTSGALCIRTEGQPTVNNEGQHIDDIRGCLLSTKVEKSGNSYTASGANGNFEFHMKDGILTSFTFEASNLYKDCDGTYTAPVLPDGALPGVFSVSAAKTVHFSKGNLWYGEVGEATTATWNFETNQYDVQSSWDASHVSHFFWSKDARVAYSDDYESANTTYNITPDASDVFFTNADDFTVNVGGKEQGGWRTLSKDEWCYLFAWTTSGSNTDTNSPRHNLHKYGVTVCGKTNCVVLLPDNWAWNASTVGADWQKNTEEIIEYSESTAIKWSTMEKAGAVCLPAAGYRDS